ncbi:hypothetical protein PA37_02714 [Pseudomonas aeruginosa]|nr:hypothetical protein PA37_02714 [Pseudomonas aeruginosa]
MAKPASTSPRRTKPALVKVPRVACGADSRASSANSTGDHMSGFFAGAKPSRNQASTRASSCGRHSRASPSSRVRPTLPPANARRWKPGCTARYWPSRASLQGASSGHSARARRRSAAARGNFSTLTNSRRAPAGATRSNSCQAQRKFSPVPKPVSPMHSTSPSPSAAKRSARRLVARNTWRVSLSPECREKYTSPKARDSGWPFSSQSSWACWKSDMAEPEKADGAFYGALPASGEALREHAAAPRRQPHADPLP